MLLSSRVWCFPPPVRRRARFAAGREARRRERFGRGAARRRCVEGEAGGPAVGEGEGVVARLGLVRLEGHEALARAAGGGAGGMWRGQGGAAGRYEGRPWVRGDSYPVVQDVGSRVEALRGEEPKLPCGMLAAAGAVRRRLGGVRLAGGQAEVRGAAPAAAPGGALKAGWAGSMMRPGRASLARPPLPAVPHGLRAADAGRQGR